MSRYIDADALLKEWKIELPKKRPVKGEHSKEVLAFMKKYENHPYYFAILSVYFTESADVVEVVHGAWKSGDCRCPVCGEDKFKGLDADIWSDWNPNYCPNCGADMRGGTE